MRRIKLYALLIMTLLLSACINNIDPKNHLDEIYSIALDSIMEVDPGLNSEMDFIAIDFTKIDRLKEATKKTILEYIKKKYKLDVMEATFEELKEQGFYNPDTSSLDGVLLRVEEVEFRMNDEVFFEGTKFRSGLGAIGIEGIVHFKEKWQIKEITEIWIS